MPTLPDPVTVICPSCSAANSMPAAQLVAAPACDNCHVALFNGAPHSVDQAGFELHVTKGTLPVLILFGAEWCGPCKEVAPKYAAAAKDLEPTMRLLNVDVDAVPDLSVPYNIRSIPTLLLMAGGQELRRKIGSTSKDQEADIAGWASYE